MKKIIIIALLLVAVIASIVFLNKKVAAPKNEAEVKPLPTVIGFSLGTTREKRWLTDQALFTQKIHELGGVVSAASTDYDIAMQISQIENLISQGIKVIVVVPADSTKIAPVIDKANEAGVKIIAYDRLINDSKVDFYISFDNVKVGALEAQSIVDVVGKGNFAYIGGSPTDNNALLVRQGSMSVLDPKIQSGDIKLVFNQLTSDWDPVIAYKNLQAYLKTGKTIDAVVAANDGTAFGAIRALHEKGLDGKVPVSGQDAELAACQRIVTGTQTSTVYKPIRLLAEQAAIIAAALARGEKPQTTGTTNNGKIDVPSYLIDPVLVTSANMADTIIKDNFHSYDEIYNKIAPPK